MTDGRIVGRHDGIAFFTVGQRRKLGVAAGERLYVVAIDPERNRVVLGKRDDLLSSALSVSGVNPITTDRLAGLMTVTVKVRYRSPFVSATIEPSGDGVVRVRFNDPVPGVCPGQAAVFYDGETVVGGGTIGRE